MNWEQARQALERGKQVLLTTGIGAKRRVRFRIVKTYEWHIEGAREWVRLDPSGAILKSAADQQFEVVEE